APGLPAAARSAADRPCARHIGRRRCRTLLVRGAPARYLARCQRRGRVWPGPRRLARRGPYRRWRADPRPPAEPYRNSTNPAKHAGRSCRRHFGNTMSKQIRNIAIIAHVDHGKTTMVDQLLRQSGTFAEHEKVVDTVMDNHAIERERGITILAKNCAVSWNDTHINILRSEERRGG